MWAGKWSGCNNNFNMVEHCDDCKTKEKVVTAVAVAKASRERAEAAGDVPMEPAGAASTGPATGGGQRFPIPSPLVRGEAPGAATPPPPRPSDAQWWLRLTTDLDLRQMARDTQESLFACEEVMRSRSVSIPGWRRMNLKRGSTYLNAKEMMRSLKLLWHAGKVTAAGLDQNDNTKRMYELLCGAWTDALLSYARRRQNLPAI